MPFVGLAEAYALAAFRSAGVPMQRIRPAIDALGRELGLEHALASKRLYTDGAEVLYDYARHAGNTPEGESKRELVVVRNNQRVFERSRRALPAAYRLPLPTATPGSSTSLSTELRK